jgi:plastocyanin
MDAVRRTVAGIRTAAYVAVPDGSEHRRHRASSRGFMKTARTTAILATALVLAACSSDPASPSVFTVVVTAPKQTIAVGEAVQLTTTARDANGVTIGGAKITYTASPTSIVSVNTTGRVIGVGAGVGTITATSAGQASLPFSITVTAGSVASVVTMQANTFTPTQVTIKAGQSVMWDFPADQHNVMFQARAGKPADIPTTSGQQVTRQFTTAGSFPYDCTLHPGMSGTVVVNP